MGGAGDLSALPGNALARGEPVRQVLEIAVGVDGRSSGVEKESETAVETVGGFGWGEVGWTVMATALGPGQKGEPGG